MATILFNYYGTTVSTDEQAFIDRLQGLGHTVDTVQDGSVVTTVENGNYDLLIIRSPAGAYEQHSETVDNKGALNNLSIPIVSMSRYVSRNELGLSSNSSASTTDSWEYKQYSPFDAGLTGTHTVYSAASDVESVSNLRNGTMMVFVDSSSTDNLTMLCNKVHQNYLRIHWGGWRGASLTGDGWTMFDNMITETLNLVTWIEPSSMMHVSSASVQLSDSSIAYLENIDQATIPTIELKHRTVDGTVSTITTMSSFNGTGEFAWYEYAGQNWLTLVCDDSDNLFVLGLDSFWSRFAVQGWIHSSGSWTAAGPARGIAGDNGIIAGSINISAVFIDKGSGTNNAGRILVAGFDELYDATGEPKYTIVDIDNVLTDTLSSTHADRFDAVTSGASPTWMVEFSGDHNRSKTGLSLATDVLGGTKVHCVAWYMWITGKAIRVATFTATSTITDIQADNSYYLGTHDNPNKYYKAIGAGSDIFVGAWNYKSSSWAIRHGTNISTRGISNWDTVYDPARGVIWVYYWYESRLRRFPYNLSDDTIGSSDLVFEYGSGERDLIRAPAKLRDRDNSIVQHNYYDGTNHNLVSYNDEIIYIEKSVWTGEATSPTDDLIENSAWHSSVQSRTEDLIEKSVWTSSATTYTYGASSWSDQGYSDIYSDIYNESITTQTQDLIEKSGWVETTGSTQDLVEQSTWTNESTVQTNVLIEKSGWTTETVQSSGDLVEPSSWSPEATATTVAAELGEWTNSVTTQTDVLIENSAWVQASSSTDDLVEKSAWHSGVQSRTEDLVEQSAWVETTGSTQDLIEKSNWTGAQTVSTEVLIENSAWVETVSRTDDLIEESVWSGEATVKTLVLIEKSAWVETTSPTGDLIENSLWSIEISEYTWARPTFNPIDFGYTHMFISESPDTQFEGQFGYESEWKHAAIQLKILDLSNVVIEEQPFKPYIYAWQRIGT